jgi:hypothetical protein
MASETAHPRALARRDWRCPRNRLVRRLDCLPTPGQSARAGVRISNQHPQRARVRLRQLLLRTHTGQVSRGARLAFGGGVLASIDVESGPEVGISSRVSTAGWPPARANSKEVWYTSQALHRCSIIEIITAIGVLLVLSMISVAISTGLDAFVYRNK